MLGWYRPGIVAICAWDSDVYQEWNNEFIKGDLEILDRLAVEREPIYVDDKQTETTSQLCRFTEVSARGFQLMSVFLHELGHHHDRMTTKSKFQPSRGEDYAQEYAIRYGEQIWNGYFDAFGW